MLRPRQRHLGAVNGTDGWTQSACLHMFTYRISEHVWPKNGLNIFENEDLTCDLLDSSEVP